MYRQTCLLRLGDSVTLADNNPSRLPFGALYNRSIGPVPGLYLNQTHTWFCLLRKHPRSWGWSRHAFEPYECRGKGLGRRGNLKVWENAISNNRIDKILISVWERCHSTELFLLHLSNFGVCRCGYIFYYWIKGAYSSVKCSKFFIRL